MDGTGAASIQLLGEPPTSPTSSDSLAARLELLLAELEEYKRLRLALLRKTSQSQDDVLASIDSYRRNLEQLLALIVQHELKPRVYARIGTASEVVRDWEVGMTYLREAAEQMNKVPKDVSIALIARLCARTAGLSGALGAVAAAAVIGTALSGVIIVGALSGAINVGASVNELVLKKSVKRANEWILQNHQYCQSLMAEFIDFKADMDHAIAGFTEADCSTLYQKAIRDNPTITLHISKAMTIGPPQVGKTTLRRRLLGLPQPEISSSTDVLERADTVMCLSGCTIPSGDVGIVSSSGLVPHDEHSSDSEGDSDADLDQTVAERCKYESNTYMADGDEWVLVNNTSGLHSLLTLLQRKMDIASTRVGSHLDEAPVQPSSDEARIRTSSGNPLIAGYNPSSVTNMIRQMYQELQKPDKANVTLPDAHLLQLLDCGGQLAYHDILPLFVNIPAIYLHVFKVSKELTECPIDELCSLKGEKKYSAESALSVAEMIARSVMTVNLLADKKVQLPSEVMHDDKSPKPHIVLVGTHLDELGEESQDARLKDISETLRKAVHTESHDLEGMIVKDPKRYGMFFPVSNKMLLKNCTSKDLKKRIRKKARCNAVKVEVPVRWYLCQLLEMSQGEKPFYAFSELYHRSIEEGSITGIEEFHAMVTYFHALGLLVHLCGADVGHTEDSDCLVFTNPSYLFENISKLYRVQFEDEVEGVAKIKLKHEGKLTEKALEELGVELNHRHFMDLLVQLFIGAEIESPEGIRTLFVPSVLVNPKSAKDATSSGADTAVQKQSVCFAIMFKHTSFIPCGVFTGVIAHLQSAPEWEICTHSISRTRMKFAVGALGTVNVLDHATHISVEMDCHDKLKPEQYQKYRDTVIQATADSYCFLFHSQADKDPRSGTCIACMNGPYLVLGQTCHSCPPQPGGTRKLQHFAELKVENCIPMTVRCQVTKEIKVLHDSALERIPFQNISHDAVVKEQHTSPTPKGVGAGKVPLHVPPETDLAKQVLDHFRDQFIAEMDANAIVFELEHVGIISNGDQRAISQNSDKTWQNQFLHACLKRTCTAEALMKVYDLAIKVKGNSRMSKLGEEMKRELKKDS